MGDWFDTYMHVSNSQDIHDNQVRLELMQRANELQQRVGYLEKKFGVELPSYYEYKQEHPVEKAQLDFKAMAIGTAAGLGLGYAFSGSSGTAKVVGSTIGAVTGGLFGGLFSESQASLDIKHLESYSKLIDNFEEQLTARATPQPQTSSHIQQGRLANDPSLSKSI